MASETRIAVEQGLAQAEILSRLENLIRKCKLPLRAPGLDREAILAAIQVDKKVRDGTPRFVLPEELGRVRHGVEVPEDVVRRCLDQILD